MNQKGVKTSIKINHRTSLHSIEFVNNGAIKLKYLTWNKNGLKEGLSFSKLTICYMLMRVLTIKV